MEGRGRSDGEISRDQSRGALVAHAKGLEISHAGLGAKGARKARRDELASSEPASHTHLLLLPVEAQLDQVPPVGLVRRRAVCRAARAEQAHAPILGELKLGDPLVHLVRLAKDEVARVGVLVVCPHIEGHTVRPKLPVEGARIV